MQCANGRLGDRASLVESALPSFASMERHGYDQHFGRSVGRELGDGSGKHAAKLARSGLHAVVLQGVDGLSHAAFVRCKRDCTYKWRRSDTARAAQVCRGNAFDRRSVKRFSASAAYAAVGDGYLHPAGFANWNGRELRQRGAAKSTGGGKECRTDCVNK